MIHFYLCLKMLIFADAKKLAYMSPKSVQYTIQIRTRKCDFLSHNNLIFNSPKFVDGRLHRIIIATPSD